MGKCQSHFHSFVVYQNDFKCGLKRFVGEEGRELFVVGHSHGSLTGSGIRLSSV